MYSPQSSQASPAILKWLHLSDWHEGRPEFDRKLVRDALLSDIEGRGKLNPSLEQLDFVFFTGDLAFSGQAAQYDKARREFIDRVVRAAGVRHDQVYFVPGNHDLDRSRLELLPKLLETLKSREALTRWLEDEDHRETLLKPMRAFRNFCAEFYKGVAGFAGVDTTYGYLKNLTVANTEVAILGLNSAWMCGQRVDGGEVNDYGYLILGEPQFHPYIPPAAARADLRIALMHHPFWWFSFLEPRARGKARLQKSCDFILRGHEHEAAVEVPSGQTGRCSVISAGAAYDRLDFPNGYNFVHLDMGQRQGTIYLRRFEPSATTFMPDISVTPRASPGYLTFTLPDEDADEKTGESQTDKTLSRRSGGIEEAPHARSSLATNKLTGDQWSLQDPLTMEKLGEVYRLQHEWQQFRQNLSSFVVTANCLLPESDPAFGTPDVIGSFKVIEAVDHPIYCVMVTLTISTVDDFAGDADWSARFRGGAQIDTIALPVTDPKSAGTRQLLLFFDPVPKPGDPPVEIDFHWRVRDSVKPLLTGNDELFINPTRAHGEIGQMDLVLHYPASFGDVSMEPSSSRKRASRAGQLMTGAEAAGYQTPAGFKTVGWTGKNQPPDKLFAVDLIPTRMPVA